MTFAIRERFRLEPWQRDAAAAWLASDDPRLGPRHGILDIYTGAGKTVVALGAMAAVAAESPGTKFAVVVPTIALAQQWVAAVSERTSLAAVRVGQVGGDRDDSFCSKDVLIYVLASARKQLGARSRLASDVAGHSVMLVVDECHKAGAQSSSRIFDAETACRLGLSATPRREDADSQDELGLVLPLERQRHGRALGAVCYRLSLRDGFEHGMLPRYEIHHHGISLTPKEHSDYSALTHRVTQARQSVSRAGGSPESYLSYLTGRANASGALRSAAMKLQSAYLERKHFLYQASERMRVTEAVLIESWRDERLGPPQGAVLFNERVGDEVPLDGEDEPDVALTTGAETLCTRIKALAASGVLPFAPDAVAVEHSRLSAAEREAALAGLRDGSVQVLVSVKALQEGIDIPDVGLGLSVASTASARQRIQTMGRILRPARDARGKRIPPEQAPVKRLHLLYVRGTVDEEVYKRTDWNDETGTDCNHWWSWDLTGDAPTQAEGLAPTDVDEPSAWERIEALRLPQPWDGPTKVLPLVHKRGTVFVLQAGDPVEVADAAPLITLLEAGKRAGAYRDARGGFKITPDLHVVLKRGAPPDDPKTQRWLAIGRLDHAPTWTAPPPNPSPASAEAPSEPAKPNPKPSSSDKQPWFILVQEGFLAATADDTAAVCAVRDRLRGPKQTWAYEAMAMLAESDAGSPTGSDDPPSSLEALLPFVAAAYVGGRNDLLERAAKGFRVGKGQKPKRLAMQNALAILAGSSQQIWYPPK